MSANEWAIAISKALSQKVVDVPKDWKTSEDLQKIWKCSETQCRKKLKLLKDAGMIESKKFTIKTEQRLYPVIHHKLIK